MNGQASLFLPDAIAYLRTTDVQGWLNYSDGLGILECLRIQNEERIPGDIAEIGVFHGNRSCCSRMDHEAARRSKLLISSSSSI
ncbi:MAG: hypothetical protein Q7V17_08455 [Afipia sp.]|nr:hypothetical protein [Afipia sp.]